MDLKNRIVNNHILAISIGLVYLWFGGLKFFPQISPAEELAKNTINSLTFNLVPVSVSIFLLALWETLVGLLLIVNIYRKPIIVFALIHMVLTFTPLFLSPKQSFVCPPFGFTLLGQYIFKNVIIVGALITLFRVPSVVNKHQ